ncbi:MAG: hypothetical protein IJK60_02230 [Clostridia bacterium]|nr:hypothetical protein [Clostridia bacterium]
MVTLKHREVKIKGIKLLRFGKSGFGWWILDGNPSVTADAVPPVSPAGSVGASACGRGVHRTPAP